MTEYRLYFGRVASQVYVVASNLEAASQKIRESMGYLVAFRLVRETIPDYVRQYQGNNILEASE